MTELDALLAALPGNVWATDADANHVSVDKNLLRIGGLGSDAPDQRRWLDAVHPDDLVGGSLIWAPVSPSSAVSAATFRLMGEGDRRAIGLRALVAPAPQEAGPTRHWIGTFFLDTPHRTAPEHVAMAILERIATIAGQSEPRPATVAPAPLHSADTNRALTKPLAVLVGCNPDDADRLSTLLELLGWRTIITSRAAGSLVQASSMTVVDHLSLVPADIARPYAGDPPIVVLCRAGSSSEAAAAKAIGGHAITIPVDIAEFENLIVAFMEQH